MSKQLKRSKRRDFKGELTTGDKSPYQRKQQAKAGRGRVGKNWQSWYDTAPGSRVGGQA